MKHTTVRIFSFVLALVTVLLSLFSCSKLPASNHEKKTVLTVGEYEVPYDLYRYVVLNFKKDIPSASDDELKEKAEEALLDIYAILKTGENYELSADDDYFETVADNAVAKAVEDAGSEDEFEKQLKNFCMTEDVFRFLTKKDAVYGELYYAMEGAGKIKSDKADIISFAESDEVICVKQVLVVGENTDMTGEMYYKPAREHTNTEAEKIAENVREKALAGEDFDNLVRDYGESLYMMQNPGGYYLCRGVWDDDVFDAVSSLAVGDISEVIENAAGYSVFLRSEKDSSYIENNTDKLTDDFGKAVFTLEIEKVRSALVTEYKDDFDMSTVTMEDNK